MKKVFKTILIIVLVLVIVGVGGCAVIMYKSNDQKVNYYKYATPVGEIETKYTALGTYKVSTAEYDSGNETYGKYLIWYPSEMKDGNATYPIVIIANGTGSKASTYKEIYNHLASWGFIVVGNEDEDSRTGASSAATLDFILKLNQDANSDFYGKVDTDNIGITGHSQGGVGAINAVTEQANGGMYKAIFALSATSRYHADELNKKADGWSCDPSKITIPCFMTAGTGTFDAGNMSEYTSSLADGEAQGICPLWWLNECYDAMPDDMDKITAIHKDSDHGDIQYKADGYMTAWFRYYLMNDTEAGKVFYGESPELLKNDLYQDVKVLKHQ